MRGAAIAKVSASKSAKFPIGSYVSAQPGWTEIAVVPEKDCQKIEVPQGGRLTDALGVLGERSLRSQLLGIVGAWYVIANGFFRFDRFDRLFWLA